MGHQISSSKLQLAALGGGVLGGLWLLSTISQTLANVVAAVVFVITATVFITLAIKGK